MLKKFFFTLAILAAALTVMACPVYAAGGFGLESTAKEAGYETTKSPTAQTAETIQKIVSTVLGFVAIVFFGMTLYGGFVWLTARGKEDKVELAKNVLEAAIIGLIIVSASYAISSFVLNRIGGSPEDMVCYYQEIGTCSATTDEAQCASSGGTWQPGPCPGQ
ncbi:MAG: hypothetical protein PHD72_04410 [Patescibacteria group bacterium]|nr:hypothetical protein [Patescibacteria group bacterium]